MARTLRSLFRRPIVDEGGVTIVEGVVAAMLLVIAALGVLQLIDVGARNTYRAEESQVLNNRLQAELEAIKRLPYAEVALTRAPASSNDRNDPRWRVSETRYAVNRDGSELKPLVYDGGPVPGGGTVVGGEVDPGPTPFAVGDVSGEIHRFVAWTSDPNCPACGAGTVKRIIVAATIDRAPVSYGRAFQEIHTEVVDPEATPDNNPGPPSEDPGTATAQFWLTDTPCSNAARQPIAEDPPGSGGHPAHNTRGICADGLKTGETRGAPDLMFIDAPALDPDYPPEGQPLYDYASDSEPGGDDIGLAMPGASSDSCALEPVLSIVDVKRLLEGLVSALELPALPGPLDGVLDLTADENKHLRVHTWVSPPIKGSGGVLLGRGTLDLFTKTMSGAVYKGEICAWLSVRQAVTIPVETCTLTCVSLGSTTIEVDLPMINVGILSGGQCRTGTGLDLSNFSYATDPWPAQWTRISLPMCFTAVDSTGTPVPAVLPENSRIVLSVMVKQSGTGGPGLELMYDAVGYESRLELETNKLLPF